MLATAATASLSVALRGTSSLRMTAALPSDGVSSSSAVRRALHFACPSCGDDLLPSEQSLRCAAADCKTTLDVAKEGHVHLAKPQKKAAAAELDAIARASLAFHAAGGFEAQFAAVADEVARALSGCPPSDEPQILIAGCGEGSCVRAVQERVDPTVGLWAVDTNKLSVRYAAKRQRSARFAVAPLHALPAALECRRERRPERLRRRQRPAGQPAVRSNWRRSATTVTRPGRSAVRARHGTCRTAARRSPCPASSSGRPRGPYPVKKRRPVVGRP